MDCRDPFVEVEESAGNVTLCVYICDGVLKRNASITFATQETTALCELHHVLAERVHIYVLIIVERSTYYTLPFLPSLDTIL